ncbi:MAG: YncE family protein, partial [Thermoplasmata archaeon]|nr:YncE family protein [Thermoplasmata archaeon]
LLYVANYVYFSVSIVNTSSNQILIHQVKLGTGQPYCLTYDPQNGYIYVGNQISGNVSILVASNHTFVGGGVKVSGDCLSMVLDPANGNIYVGNAGAGIAAVNGTVANGTGVYDPYSPEGLAYDSKDNLVYAANYGTNTITSFNGSTGVRVTGSGPLTDTFLRSTYDPLNGDVYVATPDPGFLCATPGSLTVVNASTHPTKVASIPVGYGPEASVVDPKSGFIFVANSCSNNVTIVNGTTQRTIGSGVPVGSGPIALGYDSPRDEIIVANGYSHNLTILNGSTGTIIAPNISVGPQPDGVALDPLNGWIYVADFGSGNLTVLNGSTLTKARPDIPVGGCPEGVVFDPNGGRIISVNSCTGNLTVLNGTTGSYVNPSVPAGVGPVAASLDPARDLLYVADAAGGTIAVVNLTNYKMEYAQIAVNGDPQGVAYVPATDQVQVSDFLSGTVSILATVPTVPTFNAYPATVERGQMTQLVAAPAEYSAAPLGITYTQLPAGCLSRNVTTLTCRPAATGSFRIGIVATDPMGYSGWSSLTLVVVPSL